jgi:hypothetical protein
MLEEVRSGARRTLTYLDRPSPRRGVASSGKPWWNRFSRAGDDEETGVPYFQRLDPRIPDASIVRGGAIVLLVVIVAAAPVRICPALRGGGDRAGPMDDGETKGGDHRPDLGGVQEARNVTGWI